MKTVIVGRVIAHRQSPGGHVYSYSFKSTKRKSIFGGLFKETVRDYIYEFLYENIDEADGKRVRVTVEILK